MGLRDRFCVLCHLDGHRLELVQEGGSSRRAGRRCPGRPASWPRPGHRSAAARCGHGMMPSQILDQGPEVHPALRGEEEQHLVSLKVVLHLHQLHLQAMGGNLLLTDLEGPLPPSPGSLPRSSRPPPWRCVPVGAGAGPLRPPPPPWVLPLSTLSVFQAPGGLHDDSLSRLHLHARRGQNNIAFRRF